jgi:hypothetical protein
MLRITTSYTYPASPRKIPVRYRSNIGQEIVAANLPACKTGVNPKTCKEIKFAVILAAKAETQTSREKTDDRLPLQQIKVQLLGH